MSDIFLSVYCVYSDNDNEYSMSKQTSKKFQEKITSLLEQDSYLIIQVFIYNKDTQLYEKFGCLDVDYPVKEEEVEVEVEEEERKETKTMTKYKVNYLEGTISDIENKGYCSSAEKCPVKKLNRGMELANSLDLI